MWLPLSLHLSSIAIYLSLSIHPSIYLTLSSLYILSAFSSIYFFAGNRGIVVGIEQVKGILRFVVDFGAERELWSGAKVRKYCVAPVRDEDSFAMDIVEDETFPPTLPSGYEYHDFDTVCGIARGNCGWGAPQCFLPPAVSDTHSIPAKFRSQVDPFFDLFRGTYLHLVPTSVA